MGPLLLLTSVLLSSYLRPGRVVDAQRLFTIRDITLSIEPSTDVARDTNVTLRCQALVSSSGQEVLSREYTIYKDSNVVYTKTSSTSEDLLYLLPEARVSNMGKYKCAINIEGKKMTSEAKKLTVKGLSEPVLSLSSHVVSEGEELMARCTAPGETGSIFFYFYEDSKEILEKQVNSNQAEAKLRLSSTGQHTIQCAYIVLITPDSYGSNKSSNVTVAVKELPIRALLEIVPQHKVFEGDHLAISCTVGNFLQSSAKAHLYLSQGTKLLSSGNTKVNHTMIARAKDPGEFECKLEMGNIIRRDTKTVAVTELFSVPTLTMSPAEVFQREYMTLTCKSERYASERLSREELTYTLDPPQSLLSPRGNGVFLGTALPYDFNYTCVARAKGIVKHSETLTVRPKVSVSMPKIMVVGKAVLGRPFKILCRSDTGSLPINYTLLKDDDPLRSTSVRLSSQQALFTVTVTTTDEINQYACKAQNSNRKALLSKKLNVTVIEPVRDPILTVIPGLGEISEGDYLVLLCAIAGTPPITYRWYRTGREQPLYTITSNENHANYNVTTLTKDYSGTYYCEADNHANNVVHSELLKIDVRLAVWKKAVIGGFCLLAVSALVVVACVLFFRSKRGRETYSPPASQDSYF